MKKIYIIYKEGAPFVTQNFASDEEATAFGATDTTITRIIAQRGSKVVYQRKASDGQ